jgi:hypothetical protein
MIVHISMAKYLESADGCSKEENMRRGKAMTEALKAKIPSLRHVEVGLNILHGDADYDVVSYSEYDDMAAVKQTVTHPAHDELIAFLKKVTESSHAVTYER